jgi:hypothetical protein
LIKNCNFRIEGASKFSGIVNNAFAVACAIGDNNTSPGEGLRVEGCMFEGLTGDERQMNAILCGRNVEVVQNVFTNCNKAFTYCKNTHNNYIGVVSNVFFECAKVPGASPWGPWNYTQNADISYNIFVTSTGEPFITKGNTGLNGNVSIHHNTVVGASEFMEISKNLTISPVIAYGTLIVSLAMKIFLGLYATRLYKDKLTKNIEKAKKLSLDEAKLKDYLKSKYGVTPMFIAIIAGFIEYTFFGRF